MRPMTVNLEAVKAALAERNQAKATYDAAQDHLAQLVAEAAQQDGGWYQMQQAGLRATEIQRLIRRAGKTTTGETP